MVRLRNITSLDLFFLKPEIFRFTEGDPGFELCPNLMRRLLVNDNDELASRAGVLLVRMCGVTPPRALVHLILDAIFEAIQSSPVCLESIILLSDMCCVVMESSTKGASPCSRQVLFIEWIKVF